MKRLSLALILLLFIAAAAGAAVNINTATKHELASLKGLGDKRAQEIVDYRTKYGPFKTVDDLGKVPGIGPAFVKRIRSQITIGDKTPIEKPLANTRRVWSGKVKTLGDGGLQSDKASRNVAKKLTTGTRVEEKKTR